MTKVIENLDFDSLEMHSACFHGNVFLFKACAKVLAKYPGVKRK